MLGLFINTLPIRIDLSGNPTVRNLVSRVRDLMADAYTWSALPFEALVARVSPERDLSRTPIYQVSINMRNVLRFEQPELQNVRVERLSHEDTQTPLDLILEFEHRASDLIAYFKYNINLFKHSTMGRIAGHYRRLVEEMLHNPDSPISTLQMLSNADIKTLTAGPAFTKSKFPSETIHELFTNQAAKTPGRTALIFNRKALTYQELESYSNQLANHLLEKGLTLGTTAAILLPRSELSIIALLAVLKAGCAFMPMDILSPWERQSAIFAEASPAMVITEEKLHTQVPEGYRTVTLDSEKEGISRAATSKPVVPVDQHSLMHIMFTSGTTGKPKGIRNEHLGFVNYMNHVIRKYRFSPDERMLQHTSLAWDASLFEVFRALAFWWNPDHAGREQTQQPHRDCQCNL